MNHHAGTAPASERRRQRGGVCRRGIGKRRWLARIFRLGKLELAGHLSLTILRQTQTLVRQSAALLLSLLLLLALPAASSAQAPLDVSAGKTRLDEFLARGSDYENRRLWQQAADLYERAVRTFPNQPELKDRWQKAERLYSLSRRYHDPSYLRDLLALDEPAALDLYAEILRKIEVHYVETVDLTRLVQSGYRNLDMALGERCFVETNFAGRDGKDALRNSLAPLRRELSSQPEHKVTSVGRALDEAKSACRHAEKFGLRTPGAVILEFAAAAVESLDPYSCHLTPNRLKDLYSMIDGNFVGLGVEVRGNGAGLEIVRILPDSPADDAGLREGDVIVAIDGLAIAGLAAEDAANHLQGPANSKVLLKLKPADGPIRQQSVTRKEVIVHSVTQAIMLDAERGIGYIRLGSFQKLTVRELEDAVEKLQRQNMTALILDLRGNPGGLLDVSLAVANRFIDNGVLVSTQGRAWGQSWSHRAKNLSVWKFGLVVLIDGDSASASEIFAGAVKDHQRGDLVGTRSYGKGSVQSIFPLRSAGCGLRLTTAHFYSPKGKPFQMVGVEPDAVVHRPLIAGGDEAPVPRRPSLQNDVQLREAHRRLVRQLAAR